MFPHECGNIDSIYGMRRRRTTVTLLWKGSRNGDDGHLVRDVKCFLLLHTFNHRPLTMSHTKNVFVLSQWQCIMVKNWIRKCEFQPVKFFSARLLIIQYWILLESTYQPQQFIAVFLCVIHLDISKIWSLFFDL